MNRATCNDVQHWIKQQTSVAHIMLPPRDLVHHVASCALCQGALLLTIADIVKLMPAMMHTPISVCEEDLAGYMDMERSQGSAPAIREYPHVWWRLWIDPAFAEMYQFTQVLLDAEAKGEIPAMPVPSIVSTSFARMKQIAQLLVQRTLFTRSMALGASLGSFADVDLLTEAESSEGYHVAVSLQKQTKGRWNVIVSVVPPITGHAVLSLGEAVFREPFNPAGEAVVASIPSELLTQAEGPDMMVAIEQVQA